LIWGDGSRGLGKDGRISAKLGMGLISDEENFSARNWPEPVGRAGRL